MRAEASAFYKQALEQVQAAAGHAARAAKYRAGQEEAPALLAALHARLAAAATRPASAPSALVPANASLDDLTSGLARAQAELQTREDTLRALEAETKDRADRRKAIPDLLAAANQRLSRIEASLNSTASVAETSQAALAWRTLLLAQKNAIEQELRSYDEELRFYHARADLLKARREEAARDATESKLLADAWQAALSQRRQQEAERQKQQAEIDLRFAPDAVRQLAEENAQLAQELANVAVAIDVTADATRAARAAADRWRKDLTELQATVSRIGMAEFIGPRLVRLRAALTDAANYERELKGVRADFDRVQMRQTALEELVADLADLDDVVADVLRGLKSDAAQRPWLESQVRKLYGARLETLDQLQRTYEAHLTGLIQLRSAQSERLATAAELDDFIAERILWVRSAEPLWKCRLPRDAPEILALYPALGRAAWNDVLVNLPLYAVAALAFVGLLLIRRRCIAGLHVLAARAVKISTDSFALTLAALGLTALIMLPWPALVGFAGWRIGECVSPTAGRLYELAVAYQGVLFRVALTLLTFGVLRQIARPAGLGAAHFRWEPRTNLLLRRHTGWLIAVVIGLVMLVGPLTSVAQAWRDSIGRLASIVFYLAMSGYLARILWPRNGVLTGWLEERPRNWPYRSRYIAYGLICAIPLVLIGLSVNGYTYTASQLTRRALRETLWLVLALLLSYNLLIRWLYIAHRRIGLEQARKRRAALAEARQAGSDLADLPGEEEGLSLVTLSAQARTLVRTLLLTGLAVGAWAIWADMLPALRLVGAVQIWPNGAAHGFADLTLTDLATAVIVALVTLLLARNIPGLLEMTLLQRLPLDAGSRFAITSIARYAITVIGAVITFGAVGVGWAKVQWLVAAMTVGLGFGLQEIFANFVSGLVLLFERPIRIGDVVTIGTVTGTVTRIRIRATTITDWDRKELVIPNKEFITGQVINWTLSDSTVRIVIPVGLAYGADTARAEQLLYEIARQTENVLADPAPLVLFMGFGDSTLSFELRIFVASVDHLLRVRHELNKRIDQEFRQAGIEIAFPQRDVHIRTIARRAGTQGHAGRPSGPQ